MKVFLRSCVAFLLVGAGHLFVNWEEVVPTTSNWETAVNMSDSNTAPGLASFRADPSIDERKESSAKNYSTVQCISALNRTSPHTQVGMKMQKLIVAGVQKGGTTALLKILGDLPEVIPSEGWRNNTISELHFFDWFLPQHNPPKHLQEEWQLLINPVFGAPGADLSDEIICYLRSLYASFWEPNIRSLPPGVDTRSLIALEKSPNYLCWGLTAGLVAKVEPTAKVVVVVRNPVDRVLSFYRMCQYLWKTTKYERWRVGTLPEVISEAVELLRERGVTRAPPLMMNETTGQFYYNKDQAGHSFDIVDTLAENFHCRADSPGAGAAHTHILNRGFYALHLSTWLEHPHWQLGKNFLLIRYEDYKQNNARTIQMVRNFLGLPAVEVSNREEKAEYVSNHHDNQQDSVILNYLRDFYRPYDARLEFLLKENWYSAHMGDD